VPGVVVLCGICGGLERVIACNIIVILVLSLGDLVAGAVIRGVGENLVDDVGSNVG